METVSAQIDLDRTTETISSIRAYSMKTNSTLGKRSKCKISLILVGKRQTTKLFYLKFMGTKTDYNLSMILLVLNKGKLSLIVVNHLYKSEK